MSLTKYTKFTSFTTTEETYQKIRAEQQRLDIKISDFMRFLVFKYFKEKEDKKNLQGEFENFIEDNENSEVEFIQSLN